MCTIIKKDIQIRNTHLNTFFVTLLNCQLLQHLHQSQRDMVLDAVNEMHSHVTADQIYTFIKEKYPSIGRGTVYRNLGILVEEGKVRKVEVPDGSDRFDFTLENHYHVECVKCGEIFDVDMDVISEMEKRIKDTHGMKYISHDIFFKGICQECQKKEMKDA